MIDITATHELSDFSSEKPVVQQEVTSGMAKRFSLLRITGSSTAPKAAEPARGKTSSSVKAMRSNAYGSVSNRWLLLTRLCSFLAKPAPAKNWWHARFTRAARVDDRPLVNVNCATLPAPLIESELFGHERGAFTGATARQLGRFELAHGGTIFLDEIGDLPVNLQAKLLRVLQDGEFERLGSGKTIKVNARVIAATNRNLLAAMEKGTLSLGSVLPVKHVSDQCAALEGAERRHRSFGE